MVDVLWRRMNWHRCLKHIIVTVILLGLLDLVYRFFSIQTPYFWSIFFQTPMILGFLFLYLASVAACFAPHEHPHQVHVETIEHLNGIAVIEYWCSGLLLLFVCLFVCCLFAVCLLLFDSQPVGRLSLVCQYSWWHTHCAVSLVLRILSWSKFSNIRLCFASSLLHCSGLVYGYKGDMIWMIIWVCAACVLCGWYSAFQRNCK